MKKIITLFSVVAFAMTLTGQTRHPLSGRHPGAYGFPGGNEQPSLLQPKSALSPSDYGDPPDLNWIQQFGGDGSDVAQDVVTDAAGNIFVTGYFSGPVNFGTTSLTSAGYADAFVAKVSGDGSLIWIRHLYCGEYEMVKAYGITLDHLNNVYITGYYNGAILHAGNVSLYKTGVEDLFFAKYDSAGTLLMARHYGVFGAITEGNRIAVDGGGNIFILNAYQNPAAYGCTDVTKFNYYGDIQGEIVNGAHYFDIRIHNPFTGLTGTTMPACVSVDPPDATAYDSLTLTFDPALACFQNGSLAGSPHVYMHSGVTVNGAPWQYVVSYNETGANGQSTELTANGDGTYSIRFRPASFYGVPPGSDVSQLCMVFNDGQWGSKDGRDFIPNTSDCQDIYAPLNHFTGLPSLYLTGYITANTDFGSTTLTATGSLNAPFLAKADNTGSFLWAVQGVPQGTFGTAYNRATELCIDENENIWFSGRYRRSIAFGGETFPQTFDYTPFLVKCSPSGSFTWARHAVISPITINNAYVYPAGCTIDGSGNAYLTCDLRSDTMWFGGYSVGGPGMALAKYAPDGTEAGVMKRSGTIDGITGSAGSDLFLAGSLNGNIRLIKSDGIAGNLWDHQTSGNSGTAEIFNVETDPGGYLYVYGRSEVPAPLFGGVSGTFVAKMQPSGALVWSVPLQGGYYNTGYGDLTELDHAGNLLVAGLYTDTLRIGDQTMINTGPLAAVFIAKISSDGQVIWINGDTAGQSYMEVQSVTADNENNCILAGVFSGTVVIAAYTLESAGELDAVVVKIGNSGVIWAQRAGGDNVEYIGLAGTDAQNNIYLTGEFVSRTITVGSQVFPLTSNDGDVVLIRLTPAGEATWLQAYGAGVADTSYRHDCWPVAIKTTQAGDSYLYGWTGRSNQYGDFTLESPYYYNLFLTRISNAGIVQWARIIKEKNYGWHSVQIGLDGDGNCYFGGNLRDTVYFESYRMVRQGASDLFLAKYTAAGQPGWITQFGSNPMGLDAPYATNNYLRGIAVYNDSSLFIAGSTLYDIGFDGEILHSSATNGYVSLFGADIPTGLPERGGQNNALRLFPDPAGDLLFIDAGKTPTSAVSVEILDAGGRTLIAQELAGAASVFPVEVSSLLPGLYLARIQTGDRVAAGKFVKR